MSDCTTDVVCTCVLCVLADTKKHDVVYLDANDRKNTVGRYINDACDYNSDSKVPHRFRTKYYTNVGYRYVLTLTLTLTLNPNHTCVLTHFIPLYTCRTVVQKHKLFGHCIQVFALVDIEQFAELFVRYGADYWNPPSEEPPIPDARRLSLIGLEKEIQMYKDAVFGS